MTSICDVVFIPPPANSVAFWACATSFLSVISSLAGGDQAHDPALVFVNRYSKFADADASKTIPSRLGMFFLYFPAIFAWPAVAYMYGGLPTAYHVVGCIMVTSHFIKRVMEVLFVHRYSGGMNRWMVVTVSSFYTLTAFLFAYVAYWSVPLEMAATVYSPSGPIGSLGIGLYTIGILGNFYHHYLLRTLRKPGEKEYKAPTGGLFHLVACPHYFFEVTEFFGMGLVLRHLYVYLVATDMMVRLTARAKNTIEWYAKHDIATPKGWRKIIPYIC